MSTYSNRLQPALQNLLQCVVQFFHPRSSSCPMHISADVCGGRKSLVKPVTRQNISSCSVLPPEIVTYNDTYIGGRSGNNIRCVVHDDLGWKNRTTRYILPRHRLYGWFSQFHRCGTYSVLSRNHSTAALTVKTTSSCTPGTRIVPPSSACVRLTVTSEWMSAPSRRIDQSFDTWHTATTFTVVSTTNSKYNIPFARTNKLKKTHFSFMH